MVNAQHATGTEPTNFFDKRSALYLWATATFLLDIRYNLGSCGVNSQMTVVCRCDSTANKLRILSKLGALFSGNQVNRPTWARRRGRATPQNCGGLKFLWSKSDFAVLIDDVTSVVGRRRSTLIQKQLSLSFSLSHSLSSPLFLSTFISLFHPPLPFLSLSL